MPGQIKELRDDANGDRVFNGAAWLTHHRHVRYGRRKEAGCGMCREGLDGAYSPVEGSESKADVVQDSGVNEEGSNPLSRDSLGDAEYERLLQVYDLGEV